MGQQVMDRSQAFWSGEFPQVLADGIGCRKFTFHFEVEDGRRGELLGHGADAEARVNGVGDSALAVSIAVAFGQHDLPALCHQHRAREAIGRKPSQGSIQPRP